MEERYPFHININQAWRAAAFTDNILLKLLTDHPLLQNFIPSNKNNQKSQKESPSLLLIKQIYDKI